MLLPWITWQGLVQMSWGPLEAPDSLSKLTYGVLVESLEGCKEQGELKTTILHLYAPTLSCLTVTSTLHFTFIIILQESQED